MTVTSLFPIFAPLAGGLGLLAAGYTYKLKKRSAGDHSMQDLSSQIQLGAMSFLKAEYKILALFVSVVAVLIYFRLGRLHPWPLFPGLWLLVWRDSRACVQQLVQMSGRPKRQGPEGWLRLLGSLLMVEQ